MEQNQNTLFNKQQLEEFFLNSSIDINFGNFITAIFFSFLLATIIKFTYMKVSRSLNDKEHFSEIFVPLAIITTLVITVVKFSLALSLGLVGALSIVRFRAAIKEPEELVYLFLVISILISTNANSEQSAEDIIKNRKAIFSKNYSTAKKVQSLSSSGDFDGAKKLMLDTRNGL